MSFEEKCKGGEETCNFFIHHNVNAEADVLEISIFIIWSLSNANMFALTLSFS